MNTETKNPCNYCCDEDTCMPLDWQYGLDHIFPDYNYCLMCGRKLNHGNPPLSEKLK